MTIPFLSLKSLNQNYNNEIKQVLSDFLDKGYYILSENVKNFEQQFAAYCDAKYCIGVANGLDALELIFNSLDLPKGSEVIVPANTYYASILAILNTGLQPVLVEPDLNTYLLNSDTLENFITEKTSAILAVNLYGKMCDFESISRISKKHKLKVIVDAAQSHGAISIESKDCIGADAIAYSFYPTKNLGALSDAGAVVTNNLKIAERIRACRNYGSKIKYQFDHLGMNSRLSELQAGFLSVKLQYLDQELTIRRSIAKKYLKGINNLKLILPPANSIEKDSWHLFVIRLIERDTFKDYLSNNGIGFDVHYPIPPHKQLALNQFNKLSLPITEEIHQTIISIPLNPTLSDNEVDYIINKINTF